MDSIPPVGEWECSHARPCTALLDEPGAVLTDPQRWPDRLCYPVMVESCRRWAVENAPDRAGEYPLPLDNGRRALLAIRVRSRRSFLDLFGLEGKPRITDEDRRYAEYCIDLDNHLWVGPLDFVLSGREDTSLVELARRAEYWWRSVSHKRPRGRPPGSGTYRTLADFERDVLAALRGLRNEDKRFSQAEVATRLGLSYDRTRELLRELKQQDGIDWQTLKRRAS